MTDGEGIMRIGDREAEVHPGDILLIQPEVLHAIEADGCLCYDTVVFSTEMLGSSEDRCYTEIIFPLKMCIRDRCEPYSCIFHE